MRLYVIIELTFRTVEGGAEMQPDSVWNKHFSFSTAT